jgi:hypothetical protein
MNSVKRGLRAGEVALAEDAQRSLEVALLAGSAGTRGRPPLTLVRLELAQAVFHALRQMSFWRAAAR